MSDAFAEAEALLLAAREHPTAFACLTNPAYRPAPFHWRIGDVLRDVALGREDRVILTMPPRHGKALALDTPVPTPSGWTTMGELRPGDQVFDERGVPCAVVAVSPVWRDRPVYRVITDDGDAIVADAEHEWVARLDGKRPVFHRHTTAVIARPRCKRAMVIRQGALDLPAVDLPIDPYVLGLWLGDGHTGYGSITAGDADRAFVRFEVERAGYRTRMQPSGEDTFSLTGFQRELGAAGVLKNKHIPPVYLRASAEQRRALLQGLIDSDGYVAPGGQIEFCNTNRRLADGVRELVRSLGCKASLVEGRATLYGKDCGPRYRVHFYLAGAARLPRKAANCRDGVRSPNRYITAVSAGTANTVCIQVDSPSHMFLCGRSMLPTHNSELVSVRFPAWYLGRLPNRRIIAASYAAPLASDFGRKARNIIGDGPYQAIFPGISVAQDSSAANRWDIAKHAGGYIAAGVGGPITGRGADCLLVDDPFKNREEADSQVIRDAVWDWYTSTAYTRLERDLISGQRGAVVVVATRWHQNDLIGRLLEAEDGDKWTVINFPAIDEDTGAALWPEKYDAPELDRIRRTIGSRDWSALYQQRPAPLEGGLLKRHWWRYWAEPSRAGSLQPVRYRLADDREVAHHPVPRPDLRAFDEILQSWDMAFKDTKASAFVVGQVWGRRGADRYLLTQVRGKWDFATTCKVVTRLNNVWGEGRVKLVEDKANGSAVISALRHTIPGFVAVEPHGGKEARASAVAPVIESGNVYIPHPAQAAWVDGFVNECATFPSGTYADQVDAMTQALTRWMRTAAVDRLDRGRVRPVRQKYGAAWRPVW